MLFSASKIALYTRTYDIHETVKNKVTKEKKKLNFFKFSSDNSWVVLRKLGSS